jgi:hypothetical protein
LAANQPDHPPTRVVLTGIAWMIVDASVSARWMYLVI